MLYNLLQPIQWNKVGIVIGIFAAVAVLLIALILVVAKVCKVDVDEKVTKILENLAGANCGGCGCTGCAGYASKLCKGEASLEECHVTSAEKKQEIACLLGVPYEDSTPTVSVCHCLGGENAKDAYQYVGAKDCAEQKLLSGGSKVCKYGCLGDGNCASACPDGGITLPHGCAQVNCDLCTSCGGCIKACPQNLFSRIPADAKVYIGCSSRDRGKAVMDACTRGCIACGKCAKVCPSNAITMVENLPVIDYEKCIKCGKCAESCPRKTIVTRY